MMRRQCLVAGLLLGMIGRSVAAGEVDYLEQIQPLLTTRCYECHGAEKQEGGLRLDIKNLALAGGNSGTVIVAGSPGDSLLYKYISGEDPETIMPPDGENLTPEQLMLIRDWIEQGAAWPDPPQ